MRARRIWIPALAIAVIAAVAVALFVIGDSIKSRPASVSTTLDARVVRLGADPRSLSIGVAWDKEGWCVGELRSYAKETADEIFVGPVTDEIDGSGVCAGVGSVYTTAYADLTLNAPVGNRTIVRARDGLRLPILTDRDRFVPKHPTAADISRYSGLNDSPPLGLEQQVHLADPVKLESLAEELDSLQFFPSGTINCPEDDGSYYLVDLTYGDSVDFPVRVNARGCQGVYILGVRSPAAWAGQSSPNIVDQLARLVAG